MLVAVHLLMSASGDVPGDPMRPPSDLPPPWVVGVDGGGTRGRAWVAPADHDPGDTPPGVAERDEPCNPYAVGAERAAAAIRAVVDQAWSAARAPPSGLAEAFVSVGVAGVDSGDERAALFAALASSGLAHERLELLGDPWVALEGALPAELVGPGARALLVSGTGCVAVAELEDGRRTRAGGWGSRVGDEGSGAWLGIEAVRTTLRALDGRDRPGSLSSSVQDAWGASSEALVTRARAATPGEFATLAPLVLRYGDDPIAAALRSRAVAYLAELVTTVAAKCQRDPVALALTGGVAVALGDEILSALPEALSAASQPAAGPPVAGAWRLARRRALAHIGGG